VGQSPIGRDFLMNEQTERLSLRAVYPSCRAVGGKRRNRRKIRSPDQDDSNNQKPETVLTDDAPNCGRRFRLLAFAESHLGQRLAKRFEFLGRHFDSGAVPANQ
jgi:hypothetical protein